MPAGRQATAALFLCRIRPHYPTFGAKLVRELQGQTRQYQEMYALTK